uniref:AlNc14C124G6759 protein n=1 Tax=Albugo laibachii Nc14 TaxID=890382 RepID=F0WJN4_9STRA|nr:AlNc14C124G6759 [Albugo laibachii Nc14]|eukprot:CCA21484.1 AlNc14C124G6759 [Albugo laibachii Nc14]
MARGANTAAEVWESLRNFFLRDSVHNRIQNRRKLHEFKMQKGGNIMEHFFEFDELCMALQAFGEAITFDDQLIILLGSLSGDTDSIVKIIENIQGVDLFRAKEMLHRE